MHKIFIGLIFILLCGLGGWYLANPDMWNNRDLAQRDALDGRSEAVLGNEPGPLPVPSTTPSFIEGGGWSSCNDPSTRRVTPKESIVYRWTDANGQIHFGDKKPASGSAELYDLKQGVTLDYFDLKIDYRGRRIVPFLEGQLSAQATSIYKIMAGFVGNEHLRHVQLNIIIFPDAGSFRRYARTTAGDKIENLDGLYSPRTNEAMTYIADDDIRTVEVTKHEATHVIARGIFGTLPVWLNEGLAEYFSKLNIRGQLSEIAVNEEALQLARATVRSGYPVRFTDFLTLTGEDWYSNYQANHYALASSLIYFMMGTGAGRESLVMLMKQMAEQYCQSFDSTGVLARSYPGGLNALEREFHAWLNDNAVKAPHTY